MITTHQLAPKRVIQIVSGSRSGSTLLKSVLARSPDVVSLDGEEETYIHYTGNGYGYTSHDDSFTTIQNPTLFRRLLLTELLGWTWRERWEWRLRLQFEGPKLAELLDDLDAIAIDRGQGAGPPIEWLRNHGVYGHYDVCPLEQRQSFNHFVHEMPPYIMPSYRTVRASTSDHVLDGCTLLLKSPYKVYRFGALEKVFPEAQFSYIVLLRNPAAIINGLIDGWEAPYGFHKHKTPHGWWKFEMPPGWYEYAKSPIPQKAFFQWFNSYLRIRDRWMNHSRSEMLEKTYIMRFEDFIKNPMLSVCQACTMLGIVAPTDFTLPTKMSTKPPEPNRWRRRQDTIIPLFYNNPIVEQLLYDLSYGDIDKW